jgi:hypothetical protein
MTKALEGLHRTASKAEVSESKNDKMLTIVCAWCGAFLGQKDGCGIEGTTHTICPSCFTAWKRNIFE